MHFSVLSFSLAVAVTIFVSILAPKKSTYPSPALMESIDHAVPKRTAPPIPTRVNSQSGSSIKYI
jgi:phage-related baseplate assembly protein